MVAAVVSENLVKEFRKGKVRALDDVSLSIEAGEIFGIVGPNGAGKTTFMGCLLGLLHPTSGKLLLDGHPPDSVCTHAKVGYLPERLDFVRWMNANEFMLLHASLLNLPKSEIRTTCERFLELVELPKVAWSRPIKTFSRGMLQRVGMAQALLGSPSILLLDEPSSGLDPDGVKLFRKLLQDARNRGATVIINSHQLEQLERLCDRVAFIKEGQVQKVEELKTAAATPETLIFKWIQLPQRPVDDASVRELVESAGATLESIESFQMTVNVKNEAMAADLLNKLCTSGIPIVQALPKEGRLESFFTESRNVQ